MPSQDRQCLRCGKALAARSVLCAGCGLVQHPGQGADRGILPRAAPPKPPIVDRSLHAQSKRPECTPEHAQEIAAFMSDPEPMLRHLFESVRSAPFIGANESYGRSARAIELRYESINPTFNAYAVGARPGNGDDAESGPGSESPGGPPAPKVVVMQGYVFWSRIASAAMGCCLAERARNPAPAMRSRLGELAGLLRADAVLVQSLEPHIARWASDEGAESFGEFIAGDRALVSEYSVFVGRRRSAESTLVDELSTRSALAEARMVLEGMLSWVLAHEIGHVCLHHLHRTRHQHGWNEISRNQEREADSFASSILHSRLSRHALLLGALLGELLTAWSRISGDGSGSHPRSTERFLNLIRSLPSAVADASAVYSLSERDWLSLLPADSDA